MSSSYKRLTVKRFPRVQERETAEARYWRNFTNPEVQVCVTVQLATCTCIQPLFVASSIEHDHGTLGCSTLDMALGSNQHTAHREFVGRKSLSGVVRALPSIPNGRINCRRNDAVISCARGPPPSKHDTEEDAEPRVGDVPAHATAIYIEIQSCKTVLPAQTRRSGTWATTNCCRVTLWDATRLLPWSNMLSFTARVGTIAVPVVLMEGRTHRRPQVQSRHGH